MSRTLFYHFVIVHLTLTNIAAKKSESEGFCFINEDGSHECPYDIENETFGKHLKSFTQQLHNNKYFDYCEEEEEDPNSTDEGSRFLTKDDFDKFTPKAYGEDPEVVYKTQFLPMMEESERSFKASKYRLTFYQIIQPKLLKKCPNILKDPKAIKQEYHNCWINHILEKGHELGWMVQAHLNAKDCVYFTNEGEYFDKLHKKGSVILRVHTTEFDCMEEDGKDRAIERESVARSIGYFRTKNQTSNGFISMKKNRQIKHIGLSNLLQKPKEEEGLKNFKNEIWKIAGDSDNYPIFNFGPEKEDYPQKQIRRIPVNFDEEKVTFVFPVESQ